MIKTIRDKLKSRKLAKGLAAALATTPAVASADFYDGMEGPKDAQAHYTATFGDDITHTLALKYFGAEMMGVLAGTVLPGEGIQGMFLGTGYHGIHGLMPVIGYSVSGDGSEGAAHLITQGTLDLGTFVLDGSYHLAVPVHGTDDHTPTHSFGFTPSVGHARFRMGPDLGYTVGGDFAENFTYGLLARYNFDTEEQTSWVEIGLSPETVGVQFRGNFDF